MLQTPPFNGQGSQACSNSTTSAGGDSELWSAVWSLQNRCFGSLGVQLFCPAGFAVVLCRVVGGLHQAVQGSPLGLGRLILHRV